MVLKGVHNSTNCNCSGTQIFQALQTPETNNSNQSIPQILTCLFTTYYGDVNPGDVHELILWVKNLTFPQSKPVDTISTKIDDLAAILEIRNEPNSVTKN